MALSDNPATEHCLPNGVTPCYVLSNRDETMHPALISVYHYVNYICTRIMEFLQF